MPQAALGIVAALGGISVAVAGCGSGDSRLRLPQAENARLAQALSSIQVTAYRMGRPDSPQIFTCAAVRKRPTLQRVAAVAAMARMTRRFPGAHYASPDFVDAPSVPVRTIASEQAERIRICIARVDGRERGWNKLAGNLERAASAQHAPR